MAALPSPTLQDILSTEKVQDSAGNTYPLSAHISLSHAMALFNTVRRYQPAVVLEVGMAYGISSLAILNALRDTSGRLISIDPYQESNWHNIGVANVAREGLSDQHELLQQPDYIALPRLLENNLQLDFAYIDGWHTFDYTLLDFFFIDKMLSEGGIVAFNDCGMRAVSKVLRFVRTHRSYKEIDVKLRPTYTGSNPAAGLLKRITKRSNSDRYFQKTGTEEPAWNFYKPF